MPTGGVWRAGTTILTTLPKAAAYIRFKRIFMEILYGIFAIIIFSLTGIAVAAGAFFMITLFIPFSIKRGIEDDQNISLGIIIGAIIIGISIITASVVSSKIEAVKAKPGFEVEKKS